MKAQATRADAYELIHNGVLALCRAERQGIRIDIGYCERKSVQITKRIESYQKSFEETEFYEKWHAKYRGGTNLLSGHQLGTILYDLIGIEPAKMTKSGKGATDEESLELLIPKYPELKLILMIRKLTKVRDTYLKAFVREANGEYIHPNFNLHTTRTYRSSSSNPNFQNIPKRDKDAMRICRRALYPRPGHQLLEADFASLEVHVSAFYHKDPNMIRYLKDPSSDMHGDLAKQIFFIDNLNRADPTHKVLRQAAKNGFVFPQFYGDYYKNNAHVLVEWTKLSHSNWAPGTGIEFSDGTFLSDHMRANGVKNYDDFIDRMEAIEDDFWNVRFQKYGEWRKDWVANYRKKGYLDMFTGFCCTGPAKKNEIVNYPIQGTAFHCLLETFITLDRVMQKEGWDTKLVGQIHDSIVMDVNPDELEHVQESIQWAVKKHLPEKWDWITIPLEIEADVYEVDSPWLMKKE